MKKVKTPAKTVDAPDPDAVVVLTASAVVVTGACVLVLVAPNATTMRAKRQKACSKVFILINLKVLLKYHRING